jgi:Skp family chaperone for outer membrane proteins
METRIVDFEILTKHYLNYQEGVKSINKEREVFVKRLTPLKTEMESIIRMANSGVVVDQNTQKSRTERFQQLQEEAMEIDEQFKHSMKTLRGDLNVKIYEELSEIISDWGKENSIDLITGKMEVVYLNPKLDATDSIIKELKNKDLFVEMMSKETA